MAVAAGQAPRGIARSLPLRMVRTRPACKASAGVGKPGAPLKTQARRARWAEGRCVNKAQDGCKQCDAALELYSTTGGGRGCRVRCRTAMADCGIPSRSFGSGLCAVGVTETQLRYAAAPHKELPLTMGQHWADSACTCGARVFETWCWLQQCTGAAAEEGIPIPSPASLVFLAVGPAQGGGGGDAEGGGGGPRPPASIKVVSLPTTLVCRPLGERCFWWCAQRGG